MIFYDELEGVGSYSFYLGGSGKPRITLMNMAKAGSRLEFRTSPGVLATLYKLFSLILILDPLFTGTISEKLQQLFSATEITWK
jgi:hypothetical protein